MERVRPLARVAGLSVASSQSHYADSLAQPAYYLQAFAITLGEALGGLLVGAAADTLIAILVSAHPQFEHGVMTLAILVKSTPLAATASLLTIWLGFGVLPEVSITAC